MENNTRLVYFTASWCGPCKIQKPIVEKLVTGGLKIEVLDVDTQEAFQLVHFCDVTAVPSFVKIVDGKITKKDSGMKTEDQLKEFFS